MFVEQNVPLQPHNSFGIVAKARALVRVRGEADVRELLADPELGSIPKFVLGGGSNIVLTGDVKPLVLKVEVVGRRLIEDGAARGHRGSRGRGELARVRRLDAGPGLSRPGKPGADPRDGGRLAGAERRRLRRGTAGPIRVAGRHRPVHGQDLHPGRRPMRFRLPRFRVQACRRQGGRFRPGRPRADPAGAFRLPKPWKPVLGYVDLQRKIQETGLALLRPGGSTTGFAPCAGRNCPTRA